MRKLAFVLALSLSLAGCGKRSSDALSFMYWGDLKEIEIVNRLLADFKKENPGIKVENQRMAAGGPVYDEKMTTLFSGGQEPDVFLISSYYADKYAGFKGLADLTELAGRSKALGLKDYYPEILKEFTFEGRLYVVPRDTAPVACLYYNKDHFKKMGVKFPDQSWAWPEPFGPTAAKLVKKNAKGDVEVWGYVDDWELSDTFMYSAGGAFVDDGWKPTKLVMDSPAALSGIQFRADLMYKYKAMPSLAAMTQAGGMGSADMFKMGRTAMLYSGSWQIPNFREIKDFDWDIAYPPKSAKTGKRAWQGGGSGYGISSRVQGKKAEAAWKLVEFLCRPETLAVFAASGLLQPANARVANGPAFIDGKKPANKKILLEANDEVYDRPHLVNWREIFGSGIEQALQKVWRGEATAAEALPAAVKKANEKYFPKK